MKLRHMNTDHAYTVIEIKDYKSLSVETISKVIQNNFQYSAKNLNSNHLIFHIDIKEDEVESLMDMLLPISLCWVDCHCGLVAICNSNMNVYKRFSAYQLAGKYLMYKSVQEAQAKLKKYTLNN